MFRVAKTCPKSRFFTVNIIEKNCFIPLTNIPRVWKTVFVKLSGP